MHVFHVRAPAKDLRGTSDVIDASVVLCARARDHVVLTSDSRDLRLLDPTLTLLAV